GGVIRIFQAEAKAVDKKPAGPGSGDGDRLDALLQDLLKRQRGDEQVVEALFLASLGRLPGEVEKKTGLDHVGKAKDRGEAFRDLLYSLTNTKEFREHAEALAQRARQPGK